jgi:hypothetical protein
MARKRISRKEIKEPDKFMVLSARVLDWCRAYKRRLITGGAVIVVVTASVVGWQLYNAHQRTLARVAYNQALSLYESDRYLDALAGFRKVETYGSTPYADLARLYVGNVELALGKTKDAIKTLESLTSRLGPDSMTGQLALLTLALADEKDNACDAALRVINEVIAEPGPFQQEALLAKARCSVRVGQLDNAIKVYKDYLERFPGDDSMEISLKLQELEAKVAGS